MATKKEKIATAFTKAILREYWPDCQEIEGARVQEIGIETGAMVCVPYNPRKHGGNDYGCEPGDDWYVLNPALGRKL